MKSLIMLFAFFIQVSFASDLILSPGNFDQDLNRYVFIDLRQAHYDIVYDTQSKTASVITTIQFVLSDEGLPLFDLKTANVTAMLGKQEIDIMEVNLPALSKMRALNVKLKAGAYTVIFKHDLKELVDFDGQTVKSAFWMSDLSDRSYLEKYLVTNLEYDHYLMQFDVKIINSNTKHTLMMNCESQEIELNTWTANCPDFYTASSLFYHIFQKDRFNSLTKNYNSIDGRVIPITAYSASSSVSNFMDKAFKVMAELEKDYGVWPHNQLIIYGAGSGGMEYSGATMTSLWALGHEMHHSYFARGMTPARGNAGWIDEALASWRDEGYSSYGKWQLTKTSMGAHSQYRRSTDRLAYSAGEKFIGFLNKKFNDQGGMISFLKDFNKNHIYSSLTTELFKSEMEKYFQTNLDEDFDTYILNTKKSLPNTRWSYDKRIQNPYHPDLTTEQLRDLL